jgi:hypothetical protein
MQNIMVVKVTIFDKQATGSEEMTAEKKRYRDNLLRIEYRGCIQK